MASNSDPSILAYDVLQDSKLKSRSANPPGILSDIPMINQESQSGGSNIPGGDMRRRHHVRHHNYVD